MGCTTSSSALDKEEGEAPAAAASPRRGDESSLASPRGGASLSASKDAAAAAAAAAGNPEHGGAGHGKASMMEIDAGGPADSGQEDRSWSLDEILLRAQSAERESNLASPEAAPEEPLSEERLAVAQRLRQIAFFNMHSFRQIKQIAGAMQEVRVASGRDVFEKDELEDAFFVLRDPENLRRMVIDYGQGPVPATQHVHMVLSALDEMGAASTGVPGSSHVTQGASAAGSAAAASASAAAASGGSGTATPPVPPPGQPMDNTCFGETCLRYHNVKRRFTLTVRDGGEVVLLRISPSEYRNLIIRQAKKQESQYMSFLRKVPILEGLTEEQLQALGRSLRLVKFPEDTKIITQGSPGSTFYFVESGTVKCVQRTQKGPNEVVQEVNRYTAGGYFGEGALLQDARRNADVIAVDGEVTCLTLSRQDFNDLLGGIQQLLEHNFRARVLKGVDLLRTLTDAERSELADLLVEQVYEPGEQILQQGDAGDRFYIIKEGEVRFTRTPGEGEQQKEQQQQKDKARNGRAESELLEAPAQAQAQGRAAGSPRPPPHLLPMGSDDGAHDGPSPLSSPSSAAGAGGAGSFSAGGAGAGQDAQGKQIGDGGNEEIGRLFTGQYFGEGALLTDAPRRASAFAVGLVTLLSLERSIFNRVFDQSLQDMLNRNFEKRRQEKEAAVEFTDLEQIKVLGAGSYGQVLLVNNKVTGKTYALKCMSRQRIVQMNQQRHVLNEKAILEATNHPFIVGLKQSYVSEDYVFVLLEAVLGGELFAYMRAAGRLKLKDATFYIAQVVLVFEYLHSHSIIYRDLKPENLLVAANGYLKFTDFGLSKVLPHDRKTYTLCGTPAYAAPEIYNLSGHGKASDWWTLGVLTHELLSGTTPFDGDAEEIFASMEEYARAYPNIRLPRGLGGDVGDFVLRLLNPNPNKRLGCLPRGGGARDVKMHSLFKGYSWTKLIQEQTRAPFKPAIASGFDTKNFYNPVVKGQPVQLANVDASKVRIGSEWTF